MAQTNVVDLAAWAEPSGTLVELCDQATAVLAGTTRRDDPRIVNLAAALMTALARLESLPSPGGAIGRAIDVLTHVNANNVDDVLDAIRQLRRLSATQATEPRATQPPASQPHATEPRPDPAVTHLLTPSTSPVSGTPDSALKSSHRETKHQTVATPTAVSTTAAITGTANAAALKATRNRGPATPTLPGLEP